MLPLFATYAVVSFITTASVWLIYDFSGFESSTAYYAVWISTFLFAAARSLAIAELCRDGIRDYKGIWALVWRVLAFLVFGLMIHAAIDSWGQPNGIAIFGTTLARDFAFASITVLAALLLIRRYYGLDLAPLQRLVALGIAFTCIVDVIANTVLRNIFTGYLFPWFLESRRSLWPALETQVRQVEDLWSTAHLAAFMVSMGVWCYALRKPLQAPAESPELLPASVYREMSPAINIRLSAFNDRLVELLKP